jgi:hypothetical protein
MVMRRSGEASLTLLVDLKIALILPHLLAVQPPASWRDRATSERSLGIGIERRHPPCSAPERDNHQQSF